MLGSARRPAPTAGLPALCAAALALIALTAPRARAQDSTGVTGLTVPPAAPVAQVVPPPPPPPPLPDTTSVVMLGTGMPVPNHLTQGPATAVVTGKRIFLFDAGAGVMRQMEAAGLPYRNGPITALFLTHLHSDHTLGYPDVILTSWVMGRKKPLPVYGPAGTQRMTDHIIAGWREDIEIRTNGLEHDPPNGWKVNVLETVGGLVYDSLGVKVRAIPVRHGDWQWAFGYRIDTRDKSIVISGDTSPCDSLEIAARGVDVLVHEVYPESRLKPEKRPGGNDWPAYMRAFHTSDRELGRMAARAQPKLLVLYHIVRMGGTDEELTAGIRAGGYDGPLAIGKDLDRY
jgi:ribonuclease BN (tRNA processing enzyme)